MENKIHSSSRISGTFSGLIEKHLKDKQGNPFIKHCFSIQVKGDDGRVTHPFFEIKDTMVIFLNTIKQGESITVGFNPDCKNYGTGNELSINKAYWVQPI